MTAVPATMPSASNATALRLRLASLTSAGREHPVVVAAGDQSAVRVALAGGGQVAERVAHLDGEQVVSVVADRRHVAERVDEPAGEEEVRRGVRQLGGRGVGCAG